jgi:hypothetical protein
MQPVRFSTVAVLSSLAAATLVGASAAGCNTGSPASPTTTIGPASPLPSSDAGVSTAVPFQAYPPYVYVAKVKNILVGLPPLDAELEQVESNPSSLRSLITTWMTSTQSTAANGAPAGGFAPLYQAKMMRFFELAFQQTQLAISDFADQTYPQQADINPGTTPYLVQNAQESFARTMVYYTATQPQPLTDAMLTTTFMMTTGLMEFYAFLDAWQVDDTNKVTDFFAQEYPDQPLTVQYAAGAVPLSDSITPGNSNFMHWYYPALPQAEAAGMAKGGAACATDPIVYPKATGASVHQLLMGGLVTRTAGGDKCGQYGGTVTSSQLTAADYNDWRLVTIRLPMAGETPTWFYDLQTLRSIGTPQSTADLVLRIPRIGFFTTPAFFANWQTNTSNVMRVTTNQALIVATGAAVDGTDTTNPGPNPPGLITSGPDVHALPPCIGCHQLLDPTKSILSATYSVNYHNETAPTLSPPFEFAFEGVVNKNINTLNDFAEQLATHPLVPTAWATKLCYYVNSYLCDTSDPAFADIVSDFKSSNLDWSTLVTDLLSSPLTTYATSTQTAQKNGEVVAVSRRDHLCAALNNRLGFTDVCGLNALTTKEANAFIPQVVAGLPSDGYGRGSTAPVLPNQPTLFYRAGVENICEAVAAQVIDVAPANQVAGVKQWASTTAADSTQAISDFVQIVMGLPPSDPRSAKALALLTSHFTQATSMANASDALKSTFITACLSPSAVSIGM